MDLPLYTCKLQFAVCGQPRRIAPLPNLTCRTPPPDDLTARHLSKVVESSDDAIVSKDLNGIIRTWNRAAERMFGYSAAEAVGRSIRMIIPADRQAEEDAVLARIRAGEAVAHFETIRQRKDGSLVPISLTVSPIHDDAGTVIGASKIARDITERKRADAAAAAARSRDRIIGRCDHHQEPGQHHHVLESRGGTDVRLHPGGSDRAIDSDAHSGRPAGRGRHGARQDPGRRDASITTRRFACGRTAPSSRFR